MSERGKRLQIRGSKEGKKGRNLKLEGKGERERSKWCRRREVFKNSQSIQTQYHKLFSVEVSRVENVLL
jgi:hypothetical protein